MITILLGAGASYGSGSRIPSSPPLGIELFDTIRENSAKLRHEDVVAIDELHDRFGGQFRADFERAIAQVNEEAPELIPNIVRAMGRCLMDYRIVDDRLSREENIANVESNEYTRLIRACRGLDVPIVYVTTNYDLLMETSLQLMNIDFDYMLNIESPAQTTLLKIHGSCNFFDSLDVMKAMNMSGNTYAGSATVQMGHPDVYLDIEALEKRYLEGDMLCSTPIMAQYTPGKHVNMNSDFIQELQRQYAHAAQISTQIWVIGLKRVALDDHIWSPITNSEADVVLVDPSADDKTFADLYSGSRGISLNKETFSEFHSRMLS